MSATKDTAPVAVETDGMLLVDIKVAARMLNICERRIWDLEKRGELPSVRGGKSLRFEPPALRAWVRAGCPTAPGAAEKITREGGAA